MAAKEVYQSWDPYETCHRRQFVYRPNSAAESLLCPVSTSFLDPGSQSGPLDSTVYNKEFCWKEARKPECIRTGTASGQRRNNPHPSQSFMMWRLPRDATRSPEYVRFPLTCPPSEGENCNALTTQYSSTYRCDFTGLPQGCDYVNSAEGRLAPLPSRVHSPLSTDTEMRDNYRRPKQKLELMGNHSHYCNNTRPNVSRRGIVPTVVQRQVHTKQKGSDVTTYDRFYGKRETNITPVMKSLLPQELQPLHRILPAGEMEDVKTVLSKKAYSDHCEKVDKLPTVVRKSRSPEWISSWPGPL